MENLAPATIHGNGLNLHVSHGNDKGLFATFYDRSIEVPHKSKEAGRPIFEDVPYLKIIFPGDRTRNYDQPARLEPDENRPSDPDRFPKQWAAYKSQSAQVHEGTPITEWAPLTKSQAMELKAMSIHTVEQLAAVSDHALTWLGARDMRARAAAWLKNAGDGAEVLRLQRENEALRTDVEALRVQFAELAAAQKRKGRSATQESET